MPLTAVPAAADSLPENVERPPAAAGEEAGGVQGKPLVLSDPDATAAKELRAIAETLAGRSRGLVGRPLGLSPTRRG